MAGRLVKINPKTSLVTCGNKIFTDLNREYPEELWREEGKVDELIARGFLVEVKKAKK